MDNLVAQLLAHKLGREPTPEENDEHNQIQGDATNLASGVLGTVGGPASKFGQMTQSMTPEAMNVAQQTEPSLAQRIQALASKNRMTDTGETIVEHGNPLTQEQRAAKFGEVNTDNGLTNNNSMYQKGSPTSDYWKNLMQSMRKK